MHKNSGSYYCCINKAVEAYLLGRKVCVCVWGGGVEGAVL